MTQMNWLDPECVRTEATARTAIAEEHGADVTLTMALLGLQVLEAIADLPEPDAACAAIASDVGLEFDCESKEPCGWELDSKVHLDHSKKYCHEYVEPLAHRIWTIASIVTGRQT